jgi:hypothetical protein
VVSIPLDTARHTDLVISPRKTPVN